MHKGRSSQCRAVTHDDQAPVPDVLYPEVIACSRLEQAEARRDLPAQFKSVKGVSLKSLLLLLTTAFAVLGQTAGPVPTVRLGYARIFDRECEAATHKTIPEAALNDMRQREVSFQQLWDSEATDLLGTARDLVGVPFPFKEVEAALTLCEFPSVNFPLIVNVRRYFTATTDTKIVPNTVFINTVFHELLHRYVGTVLHSRPGRSRPLADKYKDELPVVQNHLYVYAVETLTYERLRRQQELNAAILDEKTLARGEAFTRGRAIVATETPQKFVAELRVP